VDSLTITSPITLDYTELPSNATAATSLFAGIVFYNGTVPQPVMVNYTQSDGSVIPLYALPGWVQITVSSFTSNRTVNSTISKYGGTLLSALPSAGLYLASAGTQNETTFINNIKATGIALSVEPDFVAARASSLATVSDPFHSDMNLATLQSAIQNSKSNVITVIVDAGKHSLDVAGAMDAATNSQLPYIRVQDGGTTISSDDFSYKTNIATVIDAAQDANKKVVISFSTYGTCVGLNGFDDCSSAQKADAWLTQEGDLVGMLKGNEWFQGGNVIISQAAGNGAADLSNSLSLLGSDHSLGTVALNGFQFCGMLSTDGKALSSVTNWGKGTGTAPLSVVFTTPPGPEYTEYTSFAAPVCAAYASTLWEQYPTLSNAQVLQALRQGATSGPDGVPRLNLTNALAIAAGMVQSQTSTTTSYSTTSILQNNTGYQNNTYSGVLDLSITQSAQHQSTSMDVQMSFSNLTLSIYNYTSGVGGARGYANATYQYSCDWTNGTAPSYIDPHSAFSGNFSNEIDLTNSSKGVYVYGGTGDTVFPDSYYSAYLTQACGGTDAQGLINVVLEDIFSSDYGNMNGMFVSNLGNAPTNGQWLNPNGETVQLSRTFPTTSFQSSTPPTTYTGTFTLTRIK
jgi:hypothetical protein